MCSHQDNNEEYIVLVDLSQCGRGKQKTCLKSVSLVMNKISQVRHTHTFYNVSVRYYSGGNVCLTDLLALNNQMVLPSII